ncbi:hypothetical protein PBI_PBS1_10 [Bacillus phage PBS1]|uniref:Uncharacterized protein n=1 Tax=Bacillus phage PBS1 TaxID=2884423 RepID=A0A223LD04_BPPB1|nr:hypothetical protein FK780_gp010 [Bacillus phage PBS1]AST99832.1 hypothetical protein PBI_PBS1_10 [Bacillus phage PBS1]BDE75348.1 hypothetical protein [Bacillus phage PBS1]
MAEMMDEQEAKFLTDEDIDHVITSLSDDIIFDSLKEQISNVFVQSDSNPVYYITYFTGKYNYIMNKYSEYEEVCEKIKEIREEFYEKLKTLIEEKFDFTLNLPAFFDDEEKFNIIGNLYDFFIIRNKVNSVNVISGYIDREIKDLIKYYKPLIDKKDLTYNNIKKTINKDIAVIICKLPDIISNLTVESGFDLVQLMIDDEQEITNMVIGTLFDENTEYINIGESFIDNILNAIKKNEVYYLQARTQLVNKYSDKK